MKISRLSKIQIFTHDKGFYKAFFALCLPVILQNILNVALNMSDNLMLSFLGEIEIAAASQANQLYFIFTLFTFGLSSGASVLICQYWGRKDHDTINRITGMVLIFSLAVSLVFATAAIFFGKEVMTFYAKEDEVIRLGTEYLKICGWSYILSAITSVAVCLLRATEQTVLPTVVSFISLSMNVVLNYGFIFGRIGLPAHGVVGAAEATLISRAVETALIWIIIFFNKKIRLRITLMFRATRALIRDFFRYSLPVVVNETLWGMGISMYAAIIGNLGADCTAAYNVANIIERLALVACTGMGCTSGIIIGRTLGSFDSNTKRSEAQAPYLYAKTLIALNVSVGFVTSVALFFLRRPLLSLFTLSSDVLSMAYDIIGIMCIMLVFKSANTTMIVGILRSGGTTRLALAVDVTLMWLVSIPLGFVAAHIWGLPVYVVYAILVADELVKSFVAGYFVRKRVWIKNLTIR